MRWKFIGLRQAKCDCRHTHVRKYSVFQLAKANDDVDKDDDDVGCVISAEAKSKYYFDFDDRASISSSDLL